MREIDIIKESSSGVWFSIRSSIPSTARTAAATLASSPERRSTVPRQTAVTENSFSNRRMLRSQLPKMAAAISTLSNSILFSAM